MEQSIFRYGTILDVWGYPKKSRKKPQPRDSHSSDSRSSNNSNRDQRPPLTAQSLNTSNTGGDDKNEKVAAATAATMYDNQGPVIGLKRRIVRVRRPPLTKHDTDNSNSNSNSMGFEDLKKMKGTSFAFLHDLIGKKRINTNITSSHPVQFRFVFVDRLFFVVLLYNNGAHFTITIY